MYYMNGYFKLEKSFVTAKENIEYILYYGMVVNDQWKANNLVKPVPESRLAIVECRDTDVDKIVSRVVYRGETAHLDALKKYVSYRKYFDSTEVDYVETVPYKLYQVKLNMGDRKPFMFKLVKAKYSEHAMRKALEYYSKAISACGSVQIFNAEPINSQILY